MKIRQGLADLREQYVREGRDYRLDRLDYLAATIDFVLPYDAAAMLLADGEKVDQACEKGTTEAAEEAYNGLIHAGMSSAVHALERKLTTRCDFGTLATFNVKQMPAYWQAIGRLEDLMPAAPPREIYTVGCPDEVRISWTPGKNAAAQKLYRRKQNAGNWELLTPDPLQGETGMFLDEPPEEGNFEYAISSLDPEGRESPLSHRASAHFGDTGDKLTLVAAAPPGRVF